QRHPARPSHRKKTPSEAEIPVDWAQRTCPCRVLGEACPQQRDHQSRGEPQSGLPRKTLLTAAHQAGDRPVTACCDILQPGFREAGHVWELAHQLFPFEAESALWTWNHPKPLVMTTASTWCLKETIGLRAGGCNGGLDLGAVGLAP